MKRLVKWVFLIPVGALVSVFAISNRQSASLAFAVLSADDPLLTVDIPIYLIVLVSIFVGILIGGISAWFAGSEVRSNARRLRRKTRTLEKDLEATRNEEPHT